MKGAVVNKTKSTFSSSPLTDDNIFVFDEEDVLYPVFTRTENGLVPAPTGTTSVKYLREDGTWVTPPDTNTVYTHPTSHPISFITNLQNELNSKIDDNQVLTNVPLNAVFTDTIYTHPSKTWIDKSPLSGANIISNISVDTLGHPTGWITRTLTPANIGAATNGHTHSEYDKYDFWRLILNGNNAIGYSLGSGAVLNVQGTGETTVSFSGTTLLIDSTSAAADFSRTLNYKGKIPASANLNSYTGTGLFHQSTNNDAASGINYPAPRAGLLETIHEDVFIYQRYTLYDNENAYIRTYYHNNWYAWKSIVDIGTSTTYTHPSKTWVNKTNLANATVVSNLTIDSLGHPTNWTTRNLIPSDIGAEPAFSKNSAFNKNFGITAETVAEGNDTRFSEGSTAYGWGNHGSQGYITQEAIPAVVDALTSLDREATLSANQGRVLKSYIDDINGLLNSDDTTLDELQEIVNFIKTNKAELENLGISNIAGLQTVLNNLQSDIDNHINNISNPHGVTKGQVGLGSVDNTRDIDKPVSNSTQTALNAKENTFSKNTAFNKNFGTTLGTVAQGNDSRISNGQTAFNWGNHSTENYLKTVGWSIITGKPTTFPPSAHNHDASDITTGIISYDRLPSTISSLSVSQWNTAYSWGDHSVQGYLKTVPELTWSNITGKPSTFTPSAHNHSADDITSGTISYSRLPITALDKSNWDNAFANSHSHNNKAFLDNINQDLGITNSAVFKGVRIGYVIGSYLGFSSASTFSFLNSGAVQKINAGGILVSNDYSHESRVPSNGIYSLGAITSGTNILAEGNKIVATQEWVLDQGYGTGTTDGNNYTTALDFNNSTGILVIHRNGLTSLTQSLEGRYALTTHHHNSQYDNYGGWTLNAGQVQAIGAGETVNFVGGGATTITQSGNTVTISSTNNDAHSHSNKAFLDTINQSLGITNSAIFNGVRIGASVANTYFGFSSASIFSFLNSSSVQNVNVGGLLASNDYSHESRVPSNGIYSLGAITSGTNLYALGNKIVATQEWVLAQGYGAGTQPDGNNYTTALAFDAATGNFVNHRNGLPSLTQNLDGRYALTTHHHNSQYDKYGSWTLNAGTNQIISSGETVTFVGAGGTTITQNGNTVTISSTSGEGADGNNFPTAIDFNNSTGILVIHRNGLGSLTQSLEGRYALIAHTHAQYENKLTFTGAGVTRTGNTIDIPGGGGGGTADGNNYVTSASFGITNGVLTLSRNGLSSVTENMDGRYAILSTANTFTGNLTAPKFLQSSLRKLKKNIKSFKSSGLELVSKLKIVDYKLKKDNSYHIGIIADDSSKEFLSEEKDAVDLYNTIFIQAKAIQELNNKVNNQQEQIDELKDLVNKLISK